MTLASPLVCVIDDDQGFRDSLSWMVRAAGYRVSVYATAEHYLSVQQRPEAACLVVDMRMPGMSGLELQQQLLRRQEKTPLIFVTAHGDIAMAVRAMKHGAFDFVEKPFKGKALLTLIEKAARAGAPHPTKSAQRRAATERIATLSAREHEVLAGILSGKTNKAIAADLGLSHKTVEYHRSRMMEKLGAGSVAELVQLVIRTPSMFPGEQ